VSITFDNLGEAMELSMGTWPRPAPIGRHPSVTDVLPRILDLLHDQGVRCTYFLEAWSANVYPGAVRSLRAAGHEIACHGWRHEQWSAIRSRDAESALVRRSVAGLRALGIELRGFRPPGGSPTPWTPAVLAEHGFSYLSAAGEGAGLLGGLSALPFAWTGTDAFYFFDAFGELRRSLGAPAEPLTPDELVEGMERTLEETVAAGGCTSLVFHPFLNAEPERFDAMRRIVATVANRDDIWCAACADHADWVQAHGASVAVEPELDARNWR
jgi:peptidoglycan/xylan/chitin deacetylase (PgdA/CDA1 family)